MRRTVCLPWLMLTFAHVSGMMNDGHGVVVRNVILLNWKI
ncbi:Uncharacterised protein [Serratia fonticola]|uniref:Uncharacterized protein n=1 Tax=Serratia fonticola TaxID=47917 RepID=A0A4U9WJD6_SERFO|nr:Uncharacterised protein [Serratia fonticola]